MEAILRYSINSSLHDFMYKNAIFLCERLCTQFPSEENLQLLARCYLQNKQPYSAYFLLKGTQMAQSRYFFAMSCFQMDLLHEAEGALSPNAPDDKVPNGAAGHYLLGLIYRYTNRRTNAISHFKHALSLDPLLWAAYEELCHLGVSKEVTCFDERAALEIQEKFEHASNTLQRVADVNNISARTLISEDGSVNNSKFIQNNGQRDVHGTCNPTLVAGGAGNHPTNGHLCSSFFDTPPVVPQLTGVAPPPIRRHHQHVCLNPSENTAGNNIKPALDPNVQVARRKLVDEGKLRKVSGRLFSDSGPRRSARLALESGTSSYTSSTSITGNGYTNTRQTAGSKLYTALQPTVTRRGQPSLGNEILDEGNDSFDDRRAGNVSTSCSISSSMAGNSQDEQTVCISGVSLNSSEVLQGASEILKLLRMLGEGYRLSCTYRCREALAVYMSLPHKHYNTSWVLCQVGKAYFELVDYLEADRTFTQAHRLSPYSLEGLDIYSTVLYHLKEAMRLSYLSRELTSTDRLAPQSWCAVGNCYSLQRDHETALKNFQRAVQLNPRFAYAHTLCGHEYAALEDFENAIKCYQHALHVDERHYNAWYGLGMVYLRQEKFEFSEHHFRMAFKINCRSSVIISFLGTALQGLQRNEEALEMIKLAILADKRNPLPLFQKASILASMERFDEALEVIDELKEHTPHESSIYALMGKIYKQLNMNDKAVFHLGLALDLKPAATDVAAIKAAIEKLQIPDEFEDDV